MGEYRSIFSEEWRDCLRAHYRYVIRAQDTLTEQTLRHVLLQTGMGEDELHDLRREALGYDPASHAKPEIDAPADEIIEEIIDQTAPPPAAEEPFADWPDEDDDIPPASSSQLSMF